MRFAFASMILGLFCLHPGSLFSGEPPPTAVSTTVSGTVQGVGFRAMVLRQAIFYNLAGTAKNATDGSGTMNFVLQGDAKRIAAALAVIKQGTNLSKVDKIVTAPAKVDPTLKTFTDVQWTSKSRDITKPYDLVFQLRKDNSQLKNPDDAAKEYHKILKQTLKGDDLLKLYGIDIDGSWTVMGGSDGGKSLPPGAAAKLMMVVAFEDGAYVVTIMGKEVEKGTYKIDPKKKPASINMTVQEGKDTGKTQIGIMKIEADVLTMAVVIGSKDRPKSFAAAPGVEVRTLKRNK